MAHPTALRVANVMTRVLLAALLAHALFFPALPQYVAKGMPYGIALSPVAALMVSTRGRARSGTLTRN